ncbi:vacuolar protein sorting-associated protein 37B-like protein [Dinothrombium tinctorium]|uniref:Vacuolar protein sorting-associated protein 37B-like protein n=1 Tax=Dinothrombium tinctorium TaxID=1965070 RepID=A0A3S3NRA2_9ACAR|nr:vacuolar protein sorting-associated protein 37B-like protein [Dinothrombium tinctorium]RWS04977.1 vacuolar protein sorting-associated protein 37B-like protein [Dinothrombium tinctorium]
MSYYLNNDIDNNTFAHTLHRFSNDELKTLINDRENGDAKIDELIKDHPQIKKLESDREMLIASNKSLAEYNVSREPSYRQMRQSLVNSHKETNDLKREVESKKSKLEEINRQTSLDTTLALLQTAAAEAEEESDTIANKFLASELTLDEFLTQFLDKRKLSHLRRIKTEKLMEYVRKNQSSYNQMPTTSNATPPYPLRPAPPPPSFGAQMPPYPMVANPAPIGYPSAANTDFPFSRPTFR